MEQRRYEILLRAESPICQAEGTEGNHTLLMRRKICLADGTIEQIPIVTADAARHGLRESEALARLAMAGLLGEGQANLSPAALRLLFAGGMLTGRGDPNNVKLAELREMLRVLPGLGIFGGCANAQMIAGQLQVHDLVLLCEETLGLAPHWVRDTDYAQNLRSRRDYVDEEQRVRFDPELRRDKQRLLSAPALDVVTRKLDAKERAHDEGNAIAAEHTKSTMLPRTCEVLVPGSLFYWSMTVTSWNALELDTFHVALKALLAHFVVGGKQATGHGMLRPVAMDGHLLHDWATRGESVELAKALPQTGKVYAEHVAGLSEALKKHLGAVDA